MYVYFVRQQECQSRLGAVVGLHFCESVRDVMRIQAARMAVTGWLLDLVALGLRYVSPNRSLRMK